MAQDAMALDFDLSAIEEMDPSLSGGHRVTYEHEVPFELRVQQVADAPQEVGTLEAVKVKILLLGPEEAPSAVRVELTSENDLFFHYSHTLDEAGFRAVQEQQKLMVDFAEYHAVLVRMLSTCIKEPHSHLAVFVMQRAGRAHLDFIQNMEYKFIELLSCAFVASDDEAVRQSISYRYNSIKSRLALMQARLQDINALVKIKNPSLLLQLQRTPPRFPTHAGQSLGPPR
uniref:Spindle assembly abnormal protein 6 N-terminal domain-containing protein n=1 Tax=Prymnesium polylepis TaxID=72548 RepID=A0A6T8AJC6_9EUKA|mmetsp:Transcript_21843/g.58736  ORF Transcript_21843/g.58736 Transcript_21843/m.58736 type:complete len:229 (+) Transcript_21843:66-752(+)